LHYEILALTAAVIGVLEQLSPALSWGFFAHIQRLVAASDTPDSFHRLHMLVKRAPRGYFVCTATVDGLFSRSGFRNDCILECDGSLGRLQCTEGACEQTPWDGAVDYQAVEIDMFSKLATGGFPQCPSCGRMARPNVRLFDDTHWEQSVARRQEETLDSWLRELDPSCNLVILETGVGDYDRFVREKAEAMLMVFPHATLVRMQCGDGGGDARCISLDLSVEECIRDMHLEIGGSRGGSE